jgi:hypothetical protein
MSRNATYETKNLINLIVHLYLSQRVLYSLNFEDILGNFIPHIHDIQSQSPLN